jgi:glucose-6-phosphate isomerase
LADAIAAMFRGEAINTTEGRAALHVALRPPRGAQVGGAAIETEVLSQPMTGYTLHRRSFGTDVLRCPCGGRRAVTALHSTRKAAEERLAELGLPPRSLLLPPQTAPPQLDLDV